MIVENKRFTGIMFTAGLLLLVPLVAMQFTSEVKWSPFDFLVAGFLLFGTGLVVELILRKVKTTPYRIALCAGALFILFLIWAELAVGIFGTPFAGN